MKKLLFAVATLASTAIVLGESKADMRRRHAQERRELASKHQEEKNHLNDKHRHDKDVLAQQHTHEKAHHTDATSIPVHAAKGKHHRSHRPDDITHPSYKVAPSSEKQRTSKRPHKARYYRKSDHR